MEIIRKEALYNHDSELAEVSEKTFQRDFKMLKDMFKAPLGFDHNENGYFLTNTGWELNVPILDDASVMAAVLGIKITSDIMPPGQVRQKINNAVEDILSSNSADFMDSAYIESVIAASGVKVYIDPQIFTQVFKAWEGRNTLKLAYKNIKGKETEIIIDPHAVVYYNSAWYIKGELPDNSEIKVLAMHRITKAEVLDTNFTLNEDIIKSVKLGRVFDFDEIANVVVKCAPAIAPYVREQYEGKGEKIKEEKDGFITLYISSIPKVELARWILSEGGNAVVVSPESVRKDIFASASAVSEKHK